MYELPRIRLEIDSMKYQVVHALMQHHEEIEKVVSEEVDKAINTYPFVEEIADLTKQYLTQAIENALKDFFVYGKGKNAIDKIVKEIITGSQE